MMFPVRYAFCRTAVLLTLLLLPAGGQASIWSQQVHTEGSVDIQVSSALEVIPLRGYYPMRVRINNRFQRAGEWSVAVHASISYDNMATLVSRHTIRVDANDARTVDLMIPVYPAHVDDRYAYPQFNIQVTGPDTTGSSRIHRSAHYSAGAGYFVGMSRDLASRSKGELEAVVTAQSMQLLAARVALDAWPDDARSLSGLDVLVMYDNEWSELTRSRRDALKRWLASGGTLLIAARELDQSELPTGLEQGHGKWPDDWRYGWGRVIRVPAPDGAIDAAAVVKLIQALPSAFTELSKGYVGGAWSLRNMIDDIQQPLLWITVTVIVVALIIGPINIWVANKRRRVTQLLWTTPLLSVLASLGLCISILLADGIGGYGHRALFQFLLPGDQLDVRVQEQVARSGVLLNRAFRMPSDVVVSVANVNVHPGSARAFQLHPDGSAAGGWFASRAIQGQVLESVQTSRAGVTLHPPQEAGEPPMVLSSVSATLSTLYLSDTNGMYWKTENLRAGEMKTLVTMSEADYTAAWRSARAGNRMQRAINNLRTAPGVFFAVAEPVSNSFVATLPAIRWKSEYHYVAGYVRTEDAP